MIFPSQALHFLPNSLCLVVISLHVFWYGSKEQSHKFRSLSQSTHQDPTTKLRSKTKRCRKSLFVAGLSPLTRCGPVASFVDLFHTWTNWWSPTDVRLVFLVLEHYAKCIMYPKFIMHRNLNHYLLIATNRIMSISHRQKRLKAWRGDVLRNRFGNKWKTLPRWFHSFHPWAK